MSKKFFKILIPVTMIIVSIPVVLILFNIKGKEIPMNTIISVIEPTTKMKSDITLDAEEALKAYKEKNPTPEMTVEQEDKFIATYLYDHLKAKLTDEVVTKMNVSDEDIQKYLDETGASLTRTVTVKLEDGTNKVLKARGEDNLKDYKVGDKLLGGEVTEVKTNFSKKEILADAKYSVQQAKALNQLNTYVMGLIKDRT